MMEANINSSHSLFKSACERCSRSKIKCSGGTPCVSCRKRNLQCVYAFKRKRGPKPVNAKWEENPKRLKPNFMSSYEKRVWSVFFTIFKNEKKHAKENPFSWNWFVVQLCRLDTYVRQAHSEKGDRLMEVLDAFYKSMEIDRDTLCDNIDLPCPIPPHLCTYCSMAVFVGTNSGVCANHQKVSSERIPGPTVAPVEVSLLNRHSKLCQTWNPTSFDRHFENDTQPCLVYETTDDSFGVFVNERFKESFGYDGDALTKLLLWSGGGFLPWGGDILAALLVNEADLFVYLRVMATKYQALGDQLDRSEECKKLFSGNQQYLNSTQDDGTFEENVVPSMNAFPCWVNRNFRDRSRCMDLKCVVDRLEPALLQFTTTIRIKTRKKDHRVYLRFEFMCIDDLLTPLPQHSSQSELPFERVTHSEPFVNVELYHNRVAAKMDRSVWHTRQLPVTNCCPHDNKNTCSEQAKTLCKHEREEKNLDSFIFEEMEKFPNLDPWELPPAPQAIPSGNSEAATSSAAEVQLGTLELDEDFDVNGDYQSVASDIDANWLQELTHWAE